MSSGRVSYTSYPDATPETELAALSVVYKFVLESRAKKVATRSGGPDDALQVESTKEVNHVNGR